MIESQYQTKITSINESHSALVKELNDKVRALQTNYNQIFEKFEVLQREKEKEVNNFDRKFQEFQATEKKLQTQIETLKTERDKKMLESSTLIEREKEMSKAKLNEMENKARESEQKRNNQMFEFETEKTKYQLNIDHLRSQLQEAQEQLARFQRKLETLEKENVKLKGDIRQSKKTAYATGPGNYLGAARLATQYGNPEILHTSLQGLPTPTSSGGFNSTFQGANQP